MTKSMDAFNTKYFAEKLEGSLNGGKFSVYNKVNLLMKGFRGNATDKELDALKEALTKAYHKKMKELNNL
jgi:hypothetical protein